MANIKNEAGVKLAVKKLLTKYSWYFWMPPANAYGKAGISDFHALKDGKFLAIETKYGSNTPTALQLRFLSEVALHGGNSLIINESNLDYLVNFLRD